MLMKAISIFNVIVLVLVLTAGNSRAGTVYDNTTTDTGGVLMLTNNQIVGGEIFPNYVATFPYLTNFSFEFYSPTYSWAGSVSADIKFYRNDGTAFNGYPSPGTLFYDTGWFDVLNPLAYTSGTSNRITYTFGWADLHTPGNPLVPMSPTLALPSDFTVVYQFDGLTNGNQLGLPIFQPPTVGTNYGDYWLVDNTSNWELVTNVAGPVAFGQLFIADTPEPSMFSLGILGAGLLGGLLKRRK
jgi:hypothetical protein